MGASKVACAPAHTNKCGIDAWTRNHTKTNESHAGRRISLARTSEADSPFTTHFLEPYLYAFVYVQRMLSLLLLLSMASACKCVLAYQECSRARISLNLCMHACIFFECVYVHVCIHGIPAQSPFKFDNVRMMHTLLDVFMYTLVVSTYLYIRV